MYEIWLMLNIGWEIAREIAPWLLGALLLWLALLALARRRLCGARRPAAGLGLAVALLAVLLLPGLTQSGLGELSYWVDWAALIGMALGFGLAAALFTWPLLALLLRSPVCSPASLQGEKP
ncbi:MAG: hypothetical protein KAY56_00010 [Inhella sp.]|jgi:hypothetical protein|nr:hypothetical protein [Inhella sp.]